MRLRRLRSRARAYFAEESYDAAIAGFAAAFQEAPAGTAEERAMKTEHKQAQVALKRSKTVDCACRLVSPTCTKGAKLKWAHFSHMQTTRSWALARTQPRWCVLQYSVTTASQLADAACCLCLGLALRNDRRSRRPTESRVWCITRIRAARKRSSRR